jgi:hypothetical protein
MKEVILNQHKNAQCGRKHFSILQRNEESDCATRVYKSFRYQVDADPSYEEAPQAPDIFITKNFDTKRGIERFSFTVVGFFYLENRRRLHKVYFQHTLKIQIKWKSKVFSPKKSEILT